MAFDVQAFSLGTAAQLIAHATFNPMRVLVHNHEHSNNHDIYIGGSAVTVETGLHVNELPKLLKCWYCCWRFVVGLCKHFRCSMSSIQGGSLMPYFISDKNAECAGWAVEKDDGEVIGCHQTKQDAIDQMVAVSIAEEMEPGGERSVNLDLPEYIQSAARKGLDYYGKKLAGAGIVASTVREAREMAAGRITEDKVIRANAWAARHMVDLDAPKNSNPDDEEFPGAGAVAFYLWGINPLDPQPAMDWFASKSEAIKEEEMEDQDDDNESDDDRSFAFHRSPEPEFGNVSGMSEQVETRRITFNEFELRAAPQGDGMSFSGYAAVFNSDSEPLPFIERIAPGAFAKSLKSRNNIRMYMNHDSSMLLGTTRQRRFVWLRTLKACSLMLIT
jgi:hypothetical protein